MTDDEKSVLAGQALVRAADLVKEFADDPAHGMLYDAAVFLAAHELVRQMVMARATFDERLWAIDILARITAMTQEAFDQHQAEKGAPPSEIPS